MDLSEDRLVAALTRLLAEEEPGLLVGPGDDAAVVEPGTGDVLLTADLLAEGVHFTLDAISARDLGAKAIVVNVSDVAAMGGSPRFALSSIALSPPVEVAWVVELTGGMRDACREYGLSLVGGDTNRGEVVVVSVAVVGEVAPGRAVRRSGARPGDAIVVTGALGAAAGGLALSRASHAVSAAGLSEPWGRELADALARPVARVGEGQTLAQAGASAMMDLSDGLARDLGRLCDASEVGATVELGAVPVAEPLRAAAPSLGVDALELALGGGEDYELLATLDPAVVDRAAGELADRFGVTLTRVGSIIEGRGVVAVDGDGGEAPLEPKGWDHFS